MSEDIDPDEAIWSVICRQSRRLLSRFGTEDAFGEGDFSVLDDYYGHREGLIEIWKFDMLMPPVIQGVQMLLREVPDWAVVVAVHTKAKGLAWPPMGLTIHRHEIVDELRRDYLPPEFRDLRYPGGRPHDPSRDPVRQA